MTHIAHPFGQRLGIIRDWKNRWIATRPALAREYIRTDVAVRKLLDAELKGKGIASIAIDRNEKEYKITVHSARPGLIIGRSGDGVAVITKKIDMLMRTLKLTHKPVIKLDIEEVRSPESQAAIVAEGVVEALEKRMAFRRVLKMAVEKSMQTQGVKGIRVAVSGRLGGAEMARYEELKRGRIPLQTLRADIDFAIARANLPYGVIGVKVWIYRGDIFEDRKKAA
ncbi:30S ribosomal protein S3 [Candidatus Kaiserbacteria bacterium RIFCSPHIGHO2_02_FULL_50_50]|uniref:Small ribosomal subunit protein uS3 n=1 Tax=Candidatus Kaiserbacteria bacterium RIFCSPHIGHO2_02_FULL_50_50 TaxID=1798492 RepID=A0A1F6DD77_9BACT|nr:MAG: 30S ribosomal protein S3 [Candidatus Kaiserbacteria bacterium RIFCSPHIGHO2_02_FULL_50_50]OGG88180.1 MAG: 30S ribosomal protein S3 [Candidatus Kaiserbacteria bacterium RIFCSPLOWO2_12_FULL_50_10]